MPNFSGLNSGRLTRRGRDTAIAVPSPAVIGLAKSNPQAGGNTVSKSEDGPGVLDMEFIKSTVRGDFEGGHADATFVIDWELRRCIERDPDGAAPLVRFLPLRAIPPMLGLSPAASTWKLRGLAT